MLMDSSKYRKLFPIVNITIIVVNKAPIWDMQWECCDHVYDKYDETA